MLYNRDVVSNFKALSVVQANNTLLRLYQDSGKMHWNNVVDGKVKDASSSSMYLFTSSNPFCSNSGLITCGVCISQSVLLSRVFTTKDEPFA